MKVIIQDLTTGEYLSANGGWAATQEQARDFFTLLRAYHFAKEKTTGRFQVLLYCADDNFSACIIEGVGTAESTQPANQVAVETATDTFDRACMPESSDRWSYVSGYDWSGNPLN